MARFGADVSGFINGMQQMAASTTGWEQLTALAAANAASALGRLPAAISTGTASASQMAAVMQSAGNQIQGHFAAMSSSGQSFASRLGGAFSSISSGVSTVTGHIGSMVSSVGSGFVSMGSSIIGAVEGIGRFVFFARIAAEGAMGLAQAIFGQDAALEQSQVAFTGLLGSAQAADAMLRRLQAFAAATPFEFPELVHDTQLLLGMGFAAKDLIPVLTAVGDTAAGIGRGKEGIQAITLALGQMQARGKVTGQDMLQMTEAGVPAWKILAQAMHLTVAQVQDLSQQGKLGADSVTLLWQGMEKMYPKAMLGQATTFNGLLSTLKDNAGMAWQSISGPAFKMAENALSQLTNLLGSPAFRTFATTVGQQVGGAIQSIVAWVKQAVSWFGQFAPQVAQVGAAFNNLAVALAPTAARMQQAGTAGNLLAGALGALRLIIVGILAGIAFLVNGIASVIQWFNAGSPAVQRLYTMFQQLGNIISTAFIPVWKELQASWAEISAAIRPILPQLQAVGMLIAGVVVVAIVLLISIIGGLVVAFAGVIVGLTRIVTGVIVFVSGVVQACSGFVQLISDLFTGHFERIGADLERIMTGIATMFGGIMLIISGIFQVGWSIIIGFATGFVDTLVALFNGLYQTLVGGSIIPDMVNGIVSWFAQLPGRVWAFVSSLIDRVKTGFTIMWNAAVVLVTSLVNGVMNVFSQLPGRVGAAVQSAVNTIISVLQGAVGRAISAGANIVNGIAQGIRNGIGAVGDAIGSVVNFISSHLPSSPAKIGPLRELPHMGEQIPAQISEGMIAGLRSIQAATAMMVSSIPTQVTGRVDTGGTGAAASTRTSQAPATIIENHHHIYLDSREVGHLLAPVIVNQMRTRTGVRM